MSCPSDTFASITENLSVTVNWTFPVAIDNSNQAPQITVSPAGVTSPYTFYSSTVITYTATDASGNKDECSFKVALQGQKHWKYSLLKKHCWGQDGRILARILVGHLMDREEIEVHRDVKIPHSSRQDQTFSEYKRLIIRQKDWIYSQRQRGQSRADQIVPFCSWSSQSKNRIRFILSAHKQ